MSELTQEMIDDVMAEIEAEADGRRSKPCARCGGGGVKSGTKYCLPCATHVLKTLERAGYLTEVQRHGGRRRHKAEVREDVNETKHGPDL